MKIKSMKLSLTESKSENPSDAMNIKNKKVKLVQQSCTDLGDMTKTDNQGTSGNAGKTKKVKNESGMQKTVKSHKKYDDSSNGKTTPVNHEIGTSKSVKQIKKLNEDITPVAATNEGDTNKSVKKLKKMKTDDTASADKSSQQIKKRKLVETETATSQPKKKLKMKRSELKADAGTVLSASNVKDNKEKRRKKLKKYKKKAKKNLKKDTDADSSAQIMALEYLKQWKNDRSSWSFQKVRQVWLLKNMCSEKRVPNEDFVILLEYLEGLQGAARLVTVENTEKKIKEAENMKNTESTDTASEVPAVVYSEGEINRMRQVLQLLF